MARERFKNKIKWTWLKRRKICLKSEGVLVLTGASFGITSTLFNNSCSSSSVSDGGIRLTRVVLRRRTGGLSSSLPDMHPGNRPLIKSKIRQLLIYQIGTAELNLGSAVVGEILDVHKNRVTRLDLNGTTDFHSSLQHRHA